MPSKINNFAWLYLNTDPLSNPVIAYLLRELCKAFHPL